MPSDFHPAYYFIYSFHMPLFMLISGMFAETSLKSPTIWILIKKKTIKLLLPAFMWTFVRLIILAVCLRYTFKIKDIFSNFVYDYWFLKCLFICNVLFYLSIKFLRNDKIACVFTLLTVVVLPQGNFLMLNFMLPFFWVGYFFQKILNGEQNHSVLWIISTVVFIMLLVNWSNAYTVYKSPTQLFTMLSSGEVFFDKHNFFISIYRFVIGLCGSLCVIFFIFFVYKRYGKSSWEKFLSQYGRETLGIYLIQQILVVVLSRIYTFSGSTNIWLFDFIIAHH